MEEQEGTRQERRHKIPKERADGKREAMQIRNSGAERERENRRSRRWEGG